MAEYQKKLLTGAIKNKRLDEIFASDTSLLDTESKYYFEKFLQTYNSNTSGIQIEEIFHEKYFISEVGSFNKIGQANPHKQYLKAVKKGNKYVFTSNIK